MIGLVQRVKHAAVEIDQLPVCAIGRGILLFLAIEKGDNEKNGDLLIEKVLNCRIFSDQSGKMNLSLLDIRGELLIVPEFTLAGKISKGKRPSFDMAAPAEVAKKLFDYVSGQIENKYKAVKKGCFGADMSVYLINDGPVTFWLKC
ncbi:D-tyrosyl-tRNA(Tyr) deacylase [Candidatus Methylacidiphilum infernorum]|uniref:D-aminoacyl-tRNA deacylase n=1 Tax=Candidatus Methylacidiphilum infernorum TaxID=511746 RepID=A0ABX7PWH5_9BACT|nr:D-aminoacyl-tRNA deacylase [Candidatus Methylacidiphilum infernorum]QSR87023.1 D-tyrosyl-tRNA(Tyr) deacylase [Candidatus Methylacidiphilum infernorum]